MAAWDKDLLGRREVADFLQNLLESDDEIKVINIDSPWGTGKTFFLENWKQQLEADRGVVYFNAWKKDYTGDPFVSLVAAINDQLASQRGLSPELESLEGFVEKASKAIAATTPILMKFAAKGLLRRFTGIDADGAGEALQGVSDDVAEAAIQSLIENSAQEQKIVEDFTNALEKLVVEVAKNKSDYNNAPVYILIDELDRCRPTYAIELLERVKHFFNVPGCKFIIATDTAQLIHSVKAIYGHGFNSDEYLKRFFDLSYSLQVTELSKWIEVKTKGDESYYFLELTKNVSRSMNGYHGSGADVVRPDDFTEVSSELNSRQIIMLSLARTFSCSLRTYERVERHINASLSNIKEPTIHFFFLAYLAFLCNIDRELYERIVKKPNGYVLVLDDLNRKYPPRKLYFIYDNVSVHQIAYEYFNLRTQSRDELRRGMSNEAVPYISRVCQNLWEGDCKLEYEKVITLASKIGY